MSNPNADYDKSITFTLPTMNTTGHYANYNFVADTSKRITITKKVITLKMADFNAISKTYDGHQFLDASQVVLKTTGNQKGLDGVLGSDKVTLTVKDMALAFDNKKC